MSSFRGAGGDWKALRTLAAQSTGAEIDFHWHEPGGTSVPYRERMQKVHAYALTTLRIAQERGVRWLILRHGSSTSGPGRETARSVIRGLMRSSDATPYIVRKECVQHASVFLARVRIANDGNLVCSCGSAAKKAIVGALGRFRCAQCHAEFGWFTAHEVELQRVLS